MDDRREPRFQFYAAGKLSLLETPEREVDCMLLDLSVTGLKFGTEEKLPVDELVVLDIEEHLVVADVRHAERRGAKFTIGAERIHTVPKTALPRNKSREQQIRFVIEDYRRRIRLTLAGSTENAMKAESDLPVLHRDQVVEAAVQRLMEQWANESNDGASEGVLRAAIVERAAARLVEQMPTSDQRQLASR
jgi:hypothetical protein